MANNSTFNPGTSLGILDLTLPHSCLMFLCDSILVGRTEIECDDIVLFTRLLCCPENNLSQPQSLITITILGLQVSATFDTQHTYWMVRLTD